MLSCLDQKGKKKKGHQTNKERKEEGGGEAKQTVKITGSGKNVTHTLTILTEAGLIITNK